LKGKSAKPSYFKKIKIVNSEGELCKTFYIDEPIFIDFELGFNDRNLKCDLFLTVLDFKKRRIFSCETSKLNTKMQLRIEPFQLVRGNYSIETFLNIPLALKVDNIEDICDFSVIDHASPMMKHGQYDYGVVLGKYHWEHASD
jgi:lipopolysaccharide transport system ATP-binding protein